MEGSDQGQVVIENDRLKTTLTILNNKLKLQIDEIQYLKANNESLKVDLSYKDSKIS
jgi:CRISPR/Cas system CMR-associated protein Cmr5 small subunit